MEFVIKNDDSRPSVKLSYKRTLIYDYKAMPSSRNDIVPPTFNATYFQPIKDVRAAKVSSGVGLKPRYLYAIILPKHLRDGGGERTNRNQALAETIRKRGQAGDDCGHIIGAQFGGKMVEFNLFPQASKINRGLLGSGILWRRGVEEVMKLWLTLPDDLHPKVKFEMILFYECKVRPDRPSKTKFVVTFELEGVEEDLKNDKKEKRLDPILKAELLNELTVDVNEELKEYSKLNWENYASRCGNNHRLFAQLLKEILLAILEEGCKTGYILPFVKASSFY